MNSGTTQILLYFFNNKGPNSHTEKKQFLKNLFMKCRINNAITNKHLLLLLLDFQAWNVTLQRCSKSLAGRPSQLSLLISVMLHRTPRAQPKGKLPNCYNQSRELLNCYSQSRELPNCYCQSTSHILYWSQPFNLYSFYWLYLQPI